MHVLRDSSYTRPVEAVEFDNLAASLMVPKANLPHPIPQPAIGFGTPDDAWMPKPGLYFALYKMTI